MTKRDFDALTKQNWGGRGMASDERDGYRWTRQLPLYGSGAYAATWTRDRLAERAAWRRRNPTLATLDLGSPHRAPAEWRLMRRMPRLPLTREELAALRRRSV